MMRLIKSQPMNLKTFSAALVILAFFTVASAQTLDATKLSQFFDSLAEKNKAMGSLVIAKDGKVVFTRAIGFGQINGTEKKPLTAANRFRIGSITKMFTTTIIFQLVEEKKLKLTDTLDKFFPQIANSQKITIAQILAHRSGIHDSILDRNLRPVSSANEITKDEMLAIIAKGTPDFEPDAKFAYSNSGFLLLGLIIEKLTGKSYSDVLDEKITKKIELKDTYVTNGSIDVSKNESLTYFRSGAEWKQGPETNPSLMYSAGAIVSTPNDLAKFIHALFDLKLISAENLTTMKTMRDGIGMGMEPFNLGGKTFLGHTGGADNYGAWLAYLPEEKLAIAYTTNAKVYPVSDIVKGVADIYYNRPFEIPTFETVVVSQEILDKYVGVYSSPGVPVKFRISRKGDTLYIQPGEETPAPLEATAQNKFEVTVGVSFEFDVEKKQMIQKRAGRERVFTKDN